MLLPLGKYRTLDLSISVSISNFHFQVIKAWASGRLRGTRPLPQRPDSFLERVAMGGANESRSHTPERRTRKISDIK